MMWTYKATTSASSGKHNEEQMPSNAGRNLRSESHPASDKVLDFAMASPRASPALPHLMERLTKQTLSATIIKAAWRRYCTRREVDKMNKATARIQAAYRGCRTRQEMPFGFYDCLAYSKLLVKEKTEKKTAVLPLVMERSVCWVKGSQAPGVTAENESQRCQCRDRHEPGTSVTPGAIIFKAEFSLTPCKVLTLANSLLTPEVFQALSSQQQVHDAADTIWAARRTYQSRYELDKMERQAEKIAELSQIFIYSYQLTLNSCKNYQISELARVTKMQEWTTEPQDTVLHPGQVLTVKLELRKKNKDSNAEGNAPPLRKIYVHTVVKGLSTSRRPVFLHVFSTSGAVEGFYRAVGSGQLHDCTRSESMGTQSCLKSAFM
ncbi:unconventional myosin-IXb-like protein [Amazona aestiva]|uniref:Unconventional myosin-IXb-like protein n=1 Tax=Amazona aestiva TaxID=12930 RepID=A0A0Q3UR87_AMAAE|nr:unconventional myosin-IXb-like protein [Amazona aestiva]